MKLPGCPGFADPPKGHGIAFWTQEPVVTHEYMSMWVTTAWTSGGLPRASGWPRGYGPTVGERVFCRRHTYGEPSWHSVFQTDPAGQIKLDKTIVNIEARVPRDLDWDLRSTGPSEAIRAVLEHEAKTLRSATANVPARTRT